MSPASHQDNHLAEIQVIHNLYSLALATILHSRKYLESFPVDPPSSQTLKALTFNLVQLPNKWTPTHAYTLERI